MMWNTFETVLVIFYAVLQAVILAVMIGYLIDGCPVVVLSYTSYPTYSLSVFPYTNSGYVSMGPVPF